MEDTNGMDLVGWAYEIDNAVVPPEKNPQVSSRGVPVGMLSNILTYVEKLNDLDTRGIEPTSHVLYIRNVMRDDAARPGLSQESALANAPERAVGHYKVPKIIE